MKRGQNRLFGLRLRWQKVAFKVPLIDKCLILIMGILLVQSTYGLFATEIYSEFTTTIDVVVRTTIAGIFGYFISANFIKKPPEATAETPKAPALMRGDDQSWMVYEQDLQVIIVAILAVLALVVMLLARDFIVLSPNSSPTISQMRDIVCSSVGFLLGYPSGTKK